MAFCAHAKVGSDLFVIKDAKSDGRLCDNPLMSSGPKVRFYAAASLINGEGAALGTLCVIDQVPRHLESDRLDALRALARQVVALMEKHRVMNALTQALKNLDELRTLIPKCAWRKQVRDEESVGARPPNT